MRIRSLPLWLLCQALPCHAQDSLGEALPLLLGGENGARAVAIAVALALMVLIPGLLLVMTCFTRIIIVLSMLRHAMGMPDTPPNGVLILLAAFLTLLSMGDTFARLEREVAVPLLAQQLDTAQALGRAGEVMKDYMLARTREQDLDAVLALSGKTEPHAATASPALVHQAPAFLLGELRLAFQIGFVVFLPFLLVDIIIAGILMSLGMMMVPPVIISLPIKVLMFVSIDGWLLLVRVLLSDSTW